VSSEKQIVKIESIFTQSKDLVNEHQDCTEIERVLIIKNEIEDENYSDNWVNNTDILNEEITIKKDIEESLDANLSQNFPEENKISLNDDLLIKNSIKSCEKWPELLQKQEERQKELNRNKTCKKCDFIADNMLELHRHIDDSKDGCSELYNPKKECFICHKKFMLLVKKYEHVKKDHQDCFLRDCHLCLKSKLKNPVTYEKHLSRHYRSPDFVCNHCGKEFYKKESWEIHMLNHDENYWIVCDLCGYKCKTKCSLKIHMIYHLQIKTAVCEYCSKSFTSGPVLRKHHFQHHKIFPKRYNRCIKCDFCFLYR
jgi:hypothetical protein